MKKKTVIVILRWDDRIQLSPIRCTQHALTGLNKLQVSTIELYTQKSIGHASWMALVHPLYTRYTGFLFTFLPSEILPIENISMPWLWSFIIHGKKQRIYYKLYVYIWELNRQILNLLSWNTILGFLLPFAIDETRPQNSLFGLCPSQYMVA